MLGLLAWTGVSATPTVAVAALVTTAPVVTATIPVGVTPVGVAVNPLTATVYVTNFRGKTVSVISG